MLCDNFWIGQEKKRYKTIIASCISNRKKVFADAKTTVDEEIKRVKSLFTEPSKISQEAKDTMEIAYRTFSAAKGTRRVLEPVLSKYFVDPDSNSEVQIEFLRENLANKLAECKTAVNVLATHQKKNQKVCMLAKNTYISNLKSIQPIVICVFNV